MDNKRPPQTRSAGRSHFRSRPAVIGLIGWWAAAILAVAGWQLLDASLATEGRHRLQQLGIWSIGFAALGSVVGWGASIGSVLRDTGRVRAGAICLLALPLLGIFLGRIAFASTILDPRDPLAAAWLVSSGLLLVIATLLIVLPEHLGTH